MIRTAVVLDNGGSDSAVHDSSNVKGIQPGVWSSILSAGCEFGRVVADLFPEEALYCFCAVEPEYTEVTGWRPLVYAKLIDGYRTIKQAPDSGTSFTDTQLDALASGICRSLGTVPRGAATGASGWNRVLLMSGRFDHNHDAARLGSSVEAAMTAWNESLRSQPKDSIVAGKVPIHHCELICVAVGTDQFGSSDPADNTPTLSFEPEHVLRRPTISVASHRASSVALVPVVHALLRTVMNLRHVVVTNLTMKQASGSKEVNDVSLFSSEPRDVPVTDEGHGAVASSSQTPAAAPRTSGQASSQGTYDPLVLSKVSQIKQLKNQTGMLLPISAAHRVTPVDMHSEATTCFMKFLLGGQVACLTDDARYGKNKSAHKALSRIQCTHILMQHGGAVFLHYLDGSHTLMESLPTIDKCAGSGVAATEYRVQPLVDLMHKYTVKVVPPAGSMPSKSKLDVDTQFFPLCRSDAIIFDIPQFEPLVKAVTSDSMDWQAFEAAQTLFNDLVQRRASNDAYCFEGIPLSRRAPLYRQVFEEIVLLTRAYQKVSPNHHRLTCLVAKHTGSNDGTPIGPQPDRSSKPTGSGWDEVDKLSRMSERERTDANSGDQNNAHFAKRRRGNAGGMVAVEADSDMMQQIQAFANDDTRLVLSLPRMLPSSQRREAHKTAEALGLIHTSKGEGNDRHLVITKPEKKQSNETVGTSSLAGMKKASANHQPDAKRFAGWQ
eukprot:m.52142 g.52142  ORF g.52142 m.52142 type:complete len:720 (-) comp7354_c0_seq1:1841-4000(-)